MTWQYDSIDNTIRRPKPATATRVETVEEFLKRTRKQITVLKPKRQKEEKYEP